MKTHASLITFPHPTTTVSLRVGQYLVAGGIRLRLDLLQNSQVVLRDIQTNETRCTTEHHLIEAIQRKEVLLADQMPSAVKEISGHLQMQINARQESPTALAVMLEKRVWLDALHNLGIDKIVDKPWVRSALYTLQNGQLREHRNFSLSTLAQTARKLQKAGGDWSQLIPYFSARGGARQSRLDPRTEQIIDQYLDQCRRQTGKFVREEIYDWIRNKINMENLACLDDPIQMPGHSTVSRRINARFTAFEICRKNHGPERAQKQFRENSYPRDVPEFPLLFSEYDDVDCGVFLIDASNGLPCGRAFLTHGVCRATGVPLGFDLSHCARSYDSAMGAICNSLLPKNMSDPAFTDCTEPWIGYGCQGTIVLDNASYNKSKATREQSRSHSILLALTRPYTPTEKRDIESHNKTVKNSLCHHLHGWRGDKNDPDSVKRGMATAALDINAFRRFYCKWSTSVYLNNPGEDGWTPKQRWQRYFKDHGPAVRWSPEQIRLLRLRPIEPTVRESGGILRLGLTYNSDELLLLRRHVGFNGKAMAFTDCKDLTYMMIKNPYTGELFNVPCTTAHRYAEGLTEQQQSLILKIARDRGHKNPDLPKMVEARDELRDLVAREAQSSKLTRRRFAKRTGTPAPFGPLDESTETATENAGPKIIEQVMTQLEWSIHQLEEVELDFSEEW